MFPKMQGNWLDIICKSDPLPYPMPCSCHYKNLPSFILTTLPEMLELALQKHSRCLILRAVDFQFPFLGPSQQIKMIYLHTDFKTFWIYLSAYCKAHKNSEVNKLFSWKNTMVNHEIYVSLGKETEIMHFLKLPEEEWSADHGSAIYWQSTKIFHTKV